ncbi:MAG: hypothetical protein Q8784_00950 [Vigna little leaf phytoplasma]|nr:hypothetical protein [Vigna little leaf phytoplasma]
MSEVSANHSDRDNEFYERTIRGTRIIHFFLGPQANQETVLHYIKQNINSNFNNVVSKIPSYNTDVHGAIHWHIKDEEEILAIYYDGGSRNGIDENYDFVDLRWLGNGSPQMYFFGKSQK